MFSLLQGASCAAACLTAALAAIRPQGPADLPVTRLAGEPVPPAAAQSRPQTPRRVPGLPVTQLDDRSRSADLDAPQRLTLSFSQPASVRDVLLLLVRGTALSIAVDPATKGTFVGELKDVSLRRAIESVLAPNGLAFDLDGSVIRVFPRRTETRLYDLNFINIERTWHRSLKLDDGGELRARVPANDAIDEAAAGIQTLLSASGRVHVDRRAGLAQVTDYPDRLDRIATYVEALHLRGSRQVRLQVRVLEVTLKGSSGIDWRTVRSRLGLPERALTAGAVVDADAVQSVLATQGEVEVVSSPELVTLNNEAAIVRTGTTGTSALTLAVIPQISADGIVQLSLSPSWSGGAWINQTDTVVRVMDGSTVMVSGLLRPDDRAAATSGRSTRETVVLLTPSVVNAGAGPAAAR